MRFARWAWYLVALGQAFFVTGDVLAHNYKAFFGSTPEAQRRG
jgi:hypothetical protein